MNNKLVSIVVPIYQVQEYLKRCVDSILKQTYKKIEIILVDDGSTDACPQICDDYKEKDERVIVVHQQNKGVVNARKVGTKLANGEYVCYIDGDDWIENDYIANYMSHVVEKDSFDMIWSLTFKKDYKSGTIVCGMSNINRSLLNDDFYQNYIYEYVSGEHGFQYEVTYSLCTVCFKASFINYIQDMMDESIVHDEDFFCMVQSIIETRKIKFIYNEGYHYVQREGSVVRATYSPCDNKHLISEFLKKLENREEKQGIQLLIIKKFFMEQLYHGNIDFLQDEESDIIIPYRNAKKNKKIILYGMGNTGRYLLEYFKKTNVCKVVGYIDKLKNDNIYGLRQYELNELNDVQFDYVLITTVKKSYVDEIKSLLKENHVKECNIAFVDDSLLDNLVLRENT